MSFTVKKILSVGAVLGLGITVLTSTARNAAAQEEINGHPLVYAVKPLVGGDMATIEAQSQATTGLKMFTYSIKSTRTGSVGQTFKGKMVGNSPLTNKGTTTTTVYVVPLIFKIGGQTFSPTVADAACLAGKVPLTVVKNSPMVVGTHDFHVNGVDVGMGQYSDAFQRASFWKNVSANGGTFHNKLAYKFLPAVTITPGSTHSALFTVTSGCTATYGGVEINWLDGLITGTIIPSLASQGVGPTNLPVFMMYNTTMYIGNTSQCCVGGYHGAVGSPVQTYSPFQFDSVGIFGVGAEDVSIMSHEVNEWQDDPLGNNPTPAWGNVGQVAGCQTNLEVGDPLSGTNFPNVVLSGFTYHLQELAFFSWFYGKPSIGAGGKFSDHGTFTAPQGACN